MAIIKWQPKRPLGGAGGCIRVLVEILAGAFEQPQTAVVGSQAFGRKL